MIVVEPCVEGGVLVVDTDTDNWTHIVDEDVNQLIQDIKDKRDYYKGEQHV